MNIEKKENIERLPEWLDRKILKQELTTDVKQMLRSRELHTVCESAKCPNIGECFKKPTATFMILGDICTRSCRFCGVKHGKPNFVDPLEPEYIAISVLEMGLRHVVITSVDRDDLADLGVTQFIDTVRAIKKLTPSTTIEILTPDFQGKKEILDELIKEDFDIFNHNLETVKSLYKEVCPSANYEKSLFVLDYVKKNSKKITKTGIMVGLGETHKEVNELFNDISKISVDALTIGQYLRPSKNNMAVKSYIHPDEFEQYKNEAEIAGIKYVSSSPYVRSSYNAEKLMELIQNS
ncbi:lipoyl synthase [bacterium]|nr:lipoyl synthase [bacterium]